MSKVNMVKFDPEKMRKWLKDHKLTATEVSLASGRGPRYMAVAEHRGYMSQSQALAMHALYGFELADVQPDPEPEETPEDDSEYQVRVKLLPDRLCVTILRGGRVYEHAWSNRKSLSGIDTLQAISYAAHMCYKFRQQTELEKGEWQNE